MQKVSLFLLALILFACSSDDNEQPSEYTGNELSYELVAASQFPISGIVTFKERVDSGVEIVIDLDGTEGNTTHPAHFHYGDMGTPDAEIAAQLNPVIGETGKSITIVTMLNDESAFTYNDLLEFDGHIKVHQDGGPNKDVILAAGNVGIAYENGPSTGRKAKIAVCKSE